MKFKEWQIEMYHEFKDNPHKIGRLTARKYGVPWSSAFDHKQRIINGLINDEMLLQKPKILLFDIETSPVLAHVWSLWNNNVGLNQIIEDWYMLSWSAKWLDDDLVYSDCLMNYSEDFAKDPNNDYNIVKSLYAMLDEADIVIGHNGRKFDVKKTKARMLKWGFQPLSSFRIVDTLDIAKKEFNFTSNRLDYLATFLGLPNKVEHEGHTLWVKCMQGDLEAWDKMMEYNEYDVVLLEDVYKILRPWDSKHPNVAVYYNDFKTRCNCCGSDDVELTEKSAKTNLSQFAEYRCNNCGKVSRDGVTQLTKNKRSSLLRNIS